MGALALRDWARSAPRPAPPPATAAAAPSGGRGRRPCSPPVPPLEWTPRPAAWPKVVGGKDGGSRRRRSAIFVHPAQPPYTRSRAPTAHDSPGASTRRPAWSRLCASGTWLTGLEAPEVLADRRVKHV